MRAGIARAPTGNQVKAHFADRSVLYDLGPCPAGTAVRIADLLAAIEGGTGPEVSSATKAVWLYRSSSATLESIATGKAVVIS